jgi:hypothetical protein
MNKEKTEENKLETIVKDSGLEKTKADYILENFNSYFALASEWERRAKDIVVTDSSQKDIMAMARVGRLALKEKRILLEKERKKLKEQALREGKAIDGIANVLKALIVPIEDYLDKQEHFVEYKKKAEEEARRIEVEKRMEEERIAKEKAEEEKRKKIEAENKRLKEEAERRKKEIEEERRKAENERIIAERKINEERRKAEAEQKRLNDEIAKKEEAEKKAIEEKNEAEKKLKDVIKCPKCGHEISI